MDPVGPAGEPLPASVDALLQRIADGAAEADLHGVRREVIDALAENGLLGTALPTAAQRELTERLAMADASTWFCWAQHQTPLRTLDGAAPGIVQPASRSLRARWLDDLSSGRALAAVAFAHVRREGPPNPVATRVPGGWRFDGTLDWVTSWDIADVVMVMARGEADDSDLLVCAFLPAGRASGVTEGLITGPTLDLVAMSGTHTRPARLTDVRVSDDDVVLVSREKWMQADAVRTTDANPAAFGVARGAIAELREVAEERGDDQIGALADALVDRCREIRASAYAAADSDATIHERLHWRAASLQLALQAATAVVTARSGSAMQRGRSAERRVREALFLQVQAQTAVTRAASINLMRRQLREDSAAYHDALRGR